MKNSGQIEKQKRVCLTSSLLSFLLLSSERTFNSSSPFGGVINISLLSRSTVGTIASTNGTQISGPETSDPVFDSPIWSGVLIDLSLTRRRSLAPLLKTLTTVPIGSPDSYKCKFSAKLNKIRN